jgi:hypothetical protein
LDKAVIDEPLRELKDVRPVIKDDLTALLSKQRQDVLLGLLKPLKIVGGERTDFVGHGDSLLGNALPSHYHAVIQISVNPHAAIRDAPSESNKDRTERPKGDRSIYLVPKYMDLSPFLPLADGAGERGDGPACGGDRDELVFAVRVAVVEVNLDRLGARFHVP